MTSALFADNKYIYKVVATHMIKRSGTRDIIINTNIILYGLIINDKGQQYL